MVEMRRVAITAVLMAALAGGGLVAQTGSASPSAGRGPARAIVMVSTPRLPSGRGPGARSRWHQLRADSRRILDRVATRHRLAVESTVPEIGMLAVPLGPGGLPALRASLAADPRVESVDPDTRAQLRYAPNDFAFNHADANAPNDDLAQWNLIREGGPRAWDLSQGAGAEVAVVDTGIDGSHPDLARRIDGAAAFGTTAPTTDDIGHGTHTAGLACGDSDNGYGIASLGFHCGLFVAKVAFDCSAIASAITAAANRFSDVISMSLGGCGPNPVSSALGYAKSRGSVLVAAADNTPAPNGSCGDLLFDPHNCLYPEEWIQPLGSGPDARSDRGLVVTAAKYDGARASFAEQTTRVSLAAFGAASNAIGGQQGILSTWPGHPVDYDSDGGRTAINGDSRFGYLVGTSMATPQVAGVAALIRAVKPKLSNTKIVRIIKATASHCGSYGGGIGWGIVRADQAVAAALDRDIDPPHSRIRSAKRVRRGTVRLRLKRRDVRRPHCAAVLPVSGVRKVIVFASANGGRYHRVAKTRHKVLEFHGKRHRRYRFYSVAVDKQGNREAAPARPDAKARS